MSVNNGEVEEQQLNLSWLLCSWPVCLTMSDEEHKTFLSPTQRGPLDVDSPFLRTQTRALSPTYTYPLANIREETTVHTSRLRRALKTSSVEKVESHRALHSSSKKTYATRAFGYYLKLSVAIRNML